MKVESFSTSDSQSLQSNLGVSHDNPDGYISGDHIYTEHGGYVKDFNTMENTLSTLKSYVEQL
ncbi:MAG: hypothetical protein ABEJ65_12930 [bacterium]